VIKMKQKLFLIWFILLLVLVLNKAYAYPTIYPTGVTIYNKTEAYDGYTSFASTDIEGSSIVYIIDMKGNILHEWHINGSTINNLVFKNGHILSNIRLKGKCPVMGCVQVIEERDWDGNVVWQYKNNKLHHLAEPMTNGNIITIEWDLLPKAFINYVKGGIPGTELENNTIYTDVIKIVNRNNEVVWEWHPYKHLNVSDWSLNSAENRKYWPNINRIDYLPEGNPFNGKKSLLVSFRATDSLGIIDMKTKEIVWKWGKDILAHQHDPQLLKNGNIIVFDNGFLRPNVGDPYTSNSFSRVIEINPRVKKIVWEYDGTIPNHMMGFGFYSFIGGFVEKLPNDNTLITETTTGRIFEVNKKGDIVWEYVHPKAGVDSVFRFSLDEVDWAGKLSPPKQKNKFSIKIPNKFLWIIILILIIGLLVSLRLNKKKN